MMKGSTVIGVMEENGRIDGEVEDMRGGTLMDRGGGGGP